MEKTTQRYGTQSLVLLTFGARVSERAPEGMLNLDPLHKGKASLRRFIIKMTQSACQGCLAPYSFFPLVR